MMSSLPLSARARAVLDLAHELGRREPGYEPHSGHLLIALIRAGGPVIEDTAARLGIDYEAALAAVADAGAARGMPPDPLAVSIDAAGAAARRSGQVVIAASHLLLGAVAQDGAVAVRALAALGIGTGEVIRVALAYRDMLVPLLALPDPRPALERAAATGVRVRRARAWEAPALRAFIEDQAFARTWGPESANAFARLPASVFLAVRDRAIVGFAAYDCGLRGVFGPTGVAREERTAGVARALLLRTLEDMRASGYLYAIIGAVGPAEFYERACGAVLLPSAWPSYVTDSE
jgi:hypothetical protein